MYQNVKWTETAHKVWYAYRKDVKILVEQTTLALETKNVKSMIGKMERKVLHVHCLLYTSDAADE